MALSCVLTSLTLCRWPTITPSLTPSMALSRCTSSTTRLWARSASTSSSRAVGSSHSAACSPRLPQGRRSAAICRRAACRTTRPLSTLRSMHRASMAYDSW